MAKTNIPKSKPLQKTSDKKNKKPAAKKNTPKKAIKPKTVSDTLPAIMNIEFSNGLGDITVEQFRNGLSIHKERVNTSKDVHFADTQTEDMIDVKGVCSGTTRITINRKTFPETPDTITTHVPFPAYLIL